MNVKDHVLDVKSQSPHETRVPEVQLPRTCSKPR